jgi:hypothetical protein
MWRCELSLCLREDCSMGKPRRTFKPKMDEVTEGCRKLHNEKLHNLYSSFNIIRMIKSGRVRCAGHVAHNEDEKCVQNSGWEARREDITRKT